MAAQPLNLESRLKRAKGRETRTETIATRFTKDEISQLRTAAEAEGQYVGEWVREVLLREAQKRLTDRAMFTEVIALRQLLTSTLRFVATGKTMTETQYDQVTTELRSRKHSTALEVLEQYAALGGK